MAETLTIQVTLIKTIVDIQAHAGDKLMVLDGKIIGVYTGSGKPAPSQDMPATRPSKAAQASKPGKAVIRAHNPANLKKYADMQLKMLEHLEQHGKADTLTLLGLLKLPAKLRYLPRNILRQWAKRGIIAGTPIGKNRKLGQNYTCLKPEELPAIKAQLQAALAPPVPLSAA
jgi:hypothetical protein